MGDTITTIKLEDIDHFIFEDGVVLLTTNAGKRYSIDYSQDTLNQCCCPILFSH
nr:hypothetical protein [Bacteroidota bacterium]